MSSILKGTLGLSRQGVVLMSYSDRWFFRQNRKQKKCPQVNFGSWKLRAVKILEYLLAVNLNIWVFPKIGVGPQIINFNRGFHYFNHPFWRKHPVFGLTSIWTGHSQPPLASEIHNKKPGFPPVISIHKPPKQHPSVSKHRKSEPLLSWIINNTSYHVIIIIAYHSISYHIISYHIISYHIIHLHLLDVPWFSAQNWIFRCKFSGFPKRQGQIVPRLARKSANTANRRNGAKKKGAAVKILWEEIHLVKRIPFNTRIAAAFLENNRGIMENLKAVTPRRKKNIVPSWNMSISSPFKPYNVLYF